MTETTQEERDRVREHAKTDRPVQLSHVLAEKVINDADRLARIERACLLRSEVEAPPEACWWSRDIKGNGEVECVWLDEELDEVPVDGIAPNYPVNGAYATPIRLPVIDA